MDRPGSGSEGNAPVQFGSDQRIAGIFQGIQCEAQAASAPDGMGAYQRVGIRKGAVDRGTDARVGWISHVSQRYERVAPQVARPAMGYVPPPVAGHQLVIGGLEHFE